MRSVFAGTPWDTTVKTGLRGAGLGSPQARKLPRQPREPCSQPHSGRGVEGVGVRMRDPGSGGHGGVGPGAWSRGRRQGWRERPESGQDPDGEGPFVYSSFDPFMSS